RRDLEGAAHRARKAAPPRPAATAVGRHEDRASREAGAATPEARAEGREAEAHAHVDARAPGRARASAEHGSESSAREAREVLTETARGRARSEGQAARSATEPARAHAGQRPDDRLREAALRRRVDQPSRSGRPCASVTRPVSIMM